MSSSTSSSRSLYLKILLAVLLSTSAALAIVRAIAYLTDSTQETLLRRVTQARAALPRILDEEKELVMVFGSSMVHAGFSARQFDRELSERGIEIKSFNFGFGGLNPYFQDYLARRIGEAFQARERKLKLAVIEFNPFQTTQTRWRRAAPIVDSFLTLLASPREIWDITREDPTLGIRLANIRFARGSISAEMMTHRFGGFLRPEIRRSSLPKAPETERRVEELRKKLRELLEKEYPDYQGESWYYPWQGAGTIPDERSQETLQTFAEYYRTLRTSWHLDDDRIFRIETADIEELRFEETLVAAFVRIVKTFQTFSDRVEVVMLPRNTAWIEYTPEGQRRLERVLARLEKETGLPVRNYQEIEGITPEMFSDTTHLARYSGDIAFTHFLVETYAEHLGTETP